jgi:NAD(P)-dependent dehydrogenase (short-subunit alcohol dehydrogenase family)
MTHILLTRAGFTHNWGGWLIQLVAPEMMARKHCAITIVSSVGGLHDSTLIGAYNISKAADFQLARNLAMELAPHNVRINCVAPGLIKTDFARALWESPRIADAVIAGTPVRRLGDELNRRRRRGPK